MSVGRAFTFAFLAFGLLAAAARGDPLADVLQNFTIGGKPIPPEIFDDFGDASLSDDKPIVVVIDALAAIGSNRYADEITRTATGSSSRSPVRAASTDPRASPTSIAAAQQTGS